jgi:hypothetical protein
MKDKLITHLILNASREIKNQLYLSKWRFQSKNNENVLIKAILTAIVANFFKLVCDLCKRGVN